MGGERKLISISNFVSEVQVATERRDEGLCYRGDNLSGSRNRKLSLLCKWAPKMACVVSWNCQ